MTWTTSMQQHYHNAGQNTYNALLTKGNPVRHHILGNECSQDLKSAFIKYNINYQLVPWEEQCISASEWVVWTLKIVLLQSWSPWTPTSHSQHGTGCSHMQRWHILHCMGILMTIEWWQILLQTNEPLLQHMREFLAWKSLVPSSLLPCHYVRMWTRETGFLHQGLP